MVIKVPIYVEIEKYTGTELDREVYFLGRDFTFYLQGKRTEAIPEKDRSHYNKAFGEFKIISKEKALETLRTKK